LYAKATRLATFGAHTTEDGSVSAAAKHHAAASVGPARQQLDIAAGRRDIAQETRTRRERVGLGRLARSRRQRDDRRGQSEKIIPAVPGSNVSGDAGATGPTLSFAAERLADAIPGGAVWKYRCGHGSAIVSTAGVRAYMEQVSCTSVSNSSCRKPSRCETPPPGIAGWTRLAGVSGPERPAEIFRVRTGSDGDDAHRVRRWQSKRSRLCDSGERTATHVRGLTSFIEGRIDVRSALETSDLSIRNGCLEALSRYDAAEPRMLDSISIDPEPLAASAGARLAEHPENGGDTEPLLPDRRSRGIIARA
jgi:hypothetical protein